MLDLRIYRSLIRCYSSFVANRSRVTAFLTRLIHKTATTVSNGMSDEGNKGCSKPTSNALDRSVQFTHSSCSPVRYRIIALKRICMLIAFPTDACAGVCAGALTCDTENDGIGSGNWNLSQLSKVIKLDIGGCKFTTTRRLSFSMPGVPRRNLMNVSVIFTSAPSQTFL